MTRFGAEAGTAAPGRVPTTDNGPRGKPPARPSGQLRLLEIVGHKIVSVVKELTHLETLPVGAAKVGAASPRWRNWAGSRRLAIAGGGGTGRGRDGWQ